MNELPIEILTNICYHLTYSDRKCFALVCKRFLRATFFKELWQDITYVVDKTLISYTNIYFFNILTSIKFFSIKICPEQLHNIIKHSPNLRDLALVICLDLFNDTERFITCFTRDISEEVADTLGHLKSLNVSGNSDQLTDACFNCLLAPCRSLECIDLSELDFVNISTSWCPLQCVSPPYDWIYLEYLPTLVPRATELSFANIIAQLWTIRQTLTDIRLCSTHIEYDEIHLIATMPQLTLSALYLDHCKGIDGRCVQSILQYQSATLSHLSLLNTLQLPLSFIETVVSALPRLRTLRLKVSCVEEKLTILSMPSSLTQLHLESCAVTDSFIHLLNSASYLITLSLVGCNFKKMTNTTLTLPRLSSLDISRSYGFSCPALFNSISKMTTITELRLNSVKIDNDNLDFDSLSNLSYLSLVGCVKLVGGTVARCMKSVRQLKTLRLQGVNKMDDGFLREIWHTASGLEDLDLSWAVVSDLGLIQFLSKAHRLRRLRLDNCNNISDKLVGKLPSQCPYLQDVSMRNCDLIENPIELNYYDNKFLYQLKLISF